MSTLTQDFHTRLDNLLRTLVHAKPHFVRCIRPNQHESLTEFDRAHVAQQVFFGNVAPSNNKSFLTTPFYSEQVRSLQVLETVNLMAKGFPHRMRHRAFNSRYRMLVKQSLLNSSGSGTGSSNPDPDKAVQDCQIILDAYSKESSAKEQGEMTSKPARLLWTLFRHPGILKEPTFHLKF